MWRKVPRQSQDPIAALSSLLAAIVAAAFVWPARGLCVGARISDVTAGY